MKLFVKIVHVFQQLITSAKRSILGVWQDSEWVPVKLMYSYVQLLEPLIKINGPMKQLRLKKELKSWLMILPL